VLLQGASNFTFSEQLLLNLAGPVFTAVVVGLFAAWITNRAQARRERQAQAAQHHRDDQILRERLLGQASEAPSALYLATQHYWRAKQDLAPDALQPYREALDKQYLDSRRDGMVLEYLLNLHFPDPLPSRLLHRAMDLLTIRYFQLISANGASAGLRNANQGEEHTGLSAAELAAPTLVLRQYHRTVDDLVKAVATSELQVSPGGASAQVEARSASHDPP
jgi:hypothetical protein